MWWNKKTTTKPMSELINSSEETHDIASIVNDPFKKNKIVSIDAHYNKRMFSGGEWYAWGMVEFKDGNTSGSQRFEAENLDALMIQMHDFLKNMK